VQYVAHLRRAGGPSAGPPPERPPAPTRPPAPAAILTRRELEILGLLAAGSSNQEIADRLIIGVNTVKWYLRTIYDKLDSANRTQAVARARLLGLLP